MYPLRKMVAGSALAAAAVAGGVIGATMFTSANAATTPSPTSSSSAGTETGGPGGGRGGHGGGGPHQANGITEAPLTGDNLAKATAAAKTAVPGATVDRAETDADGAKYEVHMTKSDGSHVTVKLDDNFKVTSTVNGQG
jgi:hypothetical protein